LIQQWQKNNFTLEQCQDWINIGLKPTDADFCAWLRDIKGYTPEWVLNYADQEKIKQEYLDWWRQQQAQIEMPSKGNN